MPTPVPSNASFLAGYPEFAGATAGLVTAKLTDAAARTNSAFYQTPALTEQAVMLRAAILLLRSPKSLQMRLANPDQTLVWEYELRSLQRSGAVGIRVF